jgi:hypothetical protein
MFRGYFLPLVTGRPMMERNKGGIDVIFENVLFSYLKFSKFPGNRITKKDND